MNLAGHAMVAFAGYALFGGWRLFKQSFQGDPEEKAADTRFSTVHWVTIATIVCVLLSVQFLEANIGMAAFTAAVVLAALRVADHEQAIRRMPWNPILMLSGVSVLVALLDKTGGLDLFTDLLARLASPGSLTGVIAFVTGLISVYSSTSAVVLPAFLPTVPGLVARLGGDPFSVASSMNVGAHLVDMSPLSTTGAMCLAGISDPAQVRPTYNKLLAWGLSMTIVGAVFGCYSASCRPLMVKELKGIHKASTSTAVARGAVGRDSTSEGADLRRGRTLVVNHLLTTRWVKGSLTVLDWRQAPSHGVELAVATTVSVVERSSTTFSA